MDESTAARNSMVCFKSNRSIYSKYPVQRASITHIAIIESRSVEKSFFRHRDKTSTRERARTGRVHRHLYVRRASGGMSSHTTRLSQNCLRLHSFHHRRSRQARVVTSGVSVSPPRFGCPRLTCFRQKAVANFRIKRSLPQNQL